MRQARQGHVVSAVADGHAGVEQGANSPWNNRLLAATHAVDDALGPGLAIAEARLAVIGEYAEHREPKAMAISTLAFEAATACASSW